MDGDGSDGKRSSAIGEEIYGASHRDSLDRAYGPWVTAEDMERFQRSFRSYLKEMEESRRAMLGNTLSTEKSIKTMAEQTRALDILRDTVVELTRAVDRLAHLFEQRPA